MDISRLRHHSPPSSDSILESFPLSPTPTDPIPAEPQGPQSFVVDLRRSIPLSLSASFDTSAHSPEGDPRLDWLEDVAIIVMSFAVLVGVGSVKTGKSKKQFEGLNEKKNVLSRSSAMAESN
ncbi:hypothetical protein V8E52_004121 [Russula decolorans]